MTAGAPARHRSVLGWNGNAPWLLTLVDLALVLLCVFVLMAARRGEERRPTRPVVSTRPGPAARDGAAASEAVPARIAPAAPARLPRVTPAVGGAGVEGALRGIFRPAGTAVEIESGRGAVTVRLREDISFPSGSAELLPDMLPLLDAVAALLEVHPGLDVETTGHTDDVPIATSLYPSNWELSAARAAAVARRLITSAAIDPRRIKITGVAEHHPLDSRHTSESRARNRRVEIRVVEAAIRPTASFPSVPPATR